MMQQNSVRNLEQIQETDTESKVPRGVTVAFVALGGACVVFATLALNGHRAAPVARVDPLGDLVAARGHAGPAASSSAKPTDLHASEVTFPGILSDGANPTTALAAVRSNPVASASVQLVPVGAPPPAADRLPVVPLPAQNVLEASPVVTRPRDTLTKAASDSAQLATANATSASAGHDGGYQLQVSSFRSQPEANEFSDQLRARGHKAYVLEAHVTGRGTWYRVRVGPFPTQHAAAAYRASFEAKEHVVPFIVTPPGKDTK
jgi:cell division septation protein DedD